MHFLSQCILRLASSWLEGATRNKSLYQATRGVRRAAAAQARAAQEQLDDELLPKVALVGRPNVGKSALFNRLVRRRAALVYDTPTSHVTRDYQEGRAQLGDLVFRAADTSGLEPRGGSHRGTINARATAITAALLRQCHLTLLVLDAKDGVLPADEEVAGWLLRHVPRDQVLVVANKAEGAKAREEMPQTVYDCYRLGFGEPVAVSATTGDGLADLYTALQPHIDALSEQLAAATLAAKAEGPASRQGAIASPAPLSERDVTDGGPDGKGDGADKSSPRVRISLRRPRRRLLFGGSRQEALAEAAEEDLAVAGASGGGSASGGLLKLAIMGLPNAGKSTLLNRLLGEERALTGPEPGLTRDAVRASWMYGDQAVELIDTAGWIGVGRTASYDDVGGGVAEMSREATLRSLAQVHVALLVVDAERALRSNRVLAKRELSLASHVIKEGKALVLVANKADVLTQHQRALYGKSLRKHLSERFLEAGQLPMVEVSARDGKGVDGIMPLVVEAYEAWNKRVGTARLNKFVAKLSARMAGGGGTESSLARIRYMTQIKSRPPTFVAFLKGTRARPVSSSFAAFLAHQIRDVLGFPGVPLRIWFRYRDRVAERKQRLVLIRSRRGQAGSAVVGGAIGTGGDGGGDHDFAPGQGPRSILADALRRAEELRRDFDDGGYEDTDGYKPERSPGGGGSNGASKRPEALKTVRAGGDVGASYDVFRDGAEADGDAERLGAASQSAGPSAGRKRYMSPQMLRRLGAAAARHGGRGAMGQLPDKEDLGWAEADEEENGTTRSAGTVEAEAFRPRNAPAVPREAASSAFSLPSAVTARAGGRGSGARGGGDERTARGARLQYLDEDDNDWEENGDTGAGWQLEPQRPPALHTRGQVPASQRQAPRGPPVEGDASLEHFPGLHSLNNPRREGDESAAAVTAAAAAAAMVAAGARRRGGADFDVTRGSGTATQTATKAANSSNKSGGVGSGGGGSTAARAAMMRAMLFSRKPSAPLVPEQAPRRSRKQKGPR